MRQISTCILVCIVSINYYLSAQENRYSVSISGSFTTTSKLFRALNDASESMRSQFLPIDNIFGGGVDIRRNFEDLRIQIGLSIEYLAKSKQLTRTNSQDIKIPVKDGFRTLPIELSTYFKIPIGLENLFFYMGGGVGLYFGERQYEESGVQSKIVELNPAVGIQVLFGAEYLLSNRISLRSELKFRDVHFESTNKFIQNTALYNNTYIRLPSEEMHSRINIEGMTLNLGMAFHF